MTIARDVPPAQITNFTRLSNAMATTAARRTTGAMSCTKLASVAGGSANNGGMNMNTAGIMITTGMTATTIVIKKAKQVFDNEATSQFRSQMLSQPARANESGSSFFF